MDPKGEKAFLSESYFWNLFFLLFFSFFYTNDFFSPKIGFAWKGGEASRERHQAMVAASPCSRLRAARQSRAAAMRVTSAVAQRAAAPVYSLVTPSFHLAGEPEPPRATAMRSTSPPLSWRSAPSRPRGRAGRPPWRRSGRAASPRRRAPRQYLYLQVHLCPMVRLNMP